MNTQDGGRAAATTQTSQGAVRPRIAVIMCTRDRPHMIGRAVESVAQQAYERFEVVIVDQSQTDETRLIIEELMRRYACIRYLHLDVAGLSRAYNTGIRSTSAELLAFTDDDCVVPTNWLDTIVRVFEEHADVDMIYGQVLAPEELCVRQANGEGVTPALPIPTRKRLSRRDGFEVFGMAANSALRRSCWERVGGFDEILGGGGPLKSSQDFDFAYRVVRAGGTILLEPDLIAYHYGFRLLAEWPATVRAYGVGDGGFYLKHVRSGDAYAAWLLVRLLVRQSLRVAKYTMQGAGRRDPWWYLSHIVRGMGESWRYAVDREHRLYRPGKSA